MHVLISFLANKLMVVSVIALILLFFTLRAKDRKALLLRIAVAGVIAVLLAKLGGFLFYNPRPFVVGHFTPYFPHGNENGFPSEHTIVAGLIAFIVLTYNRRLGYILLSIAIIIGLARVISGVHHLVDIAGALAIAGIAAFIAGTLSTFNQRK